MLSPQQIHSSTSPNASTPFNEDVLTDSAIDFNAVKKANDALSTLIESSEPLSSPAKKYVCHCTMSIMCLHVCNTVLEQKNEEPKVIL